MPILRPPRPLSGEPPGPFAKDPSARRLRLLIDLPVEARLPDTSTSSWERPGVPQPETFLWSLGQRDDIDLTWIAAGDDQDARGGVRLHDPDRDSDQLPFTTATAGGRTLRAVWQYRQWEAFAARTTPAGIEPATWLRDVCTARVAVEMRADLIATASPALLDSDGPPIREANPVTASGALAVVGLYLRRRGQFPVLAPNELSFDEHLLAWTAARSQLPSGWRWGSALVAHSIATGRDGPALLFGSLHERIVRVLRYRDNLHGALLLPQNYNTANEVTEALDNLMVNLVGSFDAAARVAHLCLGLSASKRHLAGWQRSDWRKQVGTTDPTLAKLFAPGATHGAVLTICRMLRNTVHGEALQATNVHAPGRPPTTLVALPEDDAEDLRRLFDQLGGSEAWGLRPIGGHRAHIDAALLVERVLPRALRALDDALRLTPVDRLTGVDPATLLSSPPDEPSFGFGTRTRASLLYGLPVPRQ